VFVVVGILPFLGVGAMILGWGRELPGPKSS